MTRLLSLVQRHSPRVWLLWGCGALALIALPVAVMDPAILMLLLDPELLALIVVSAAGLIRARMGKITLVTRPLACGAIAGPAFLTIVSIAGHGRAGYDARRHPVSSLALGPGGLVQRANIIVTGTLYLAGGVGLARAGRTRRISRAGLTTIAAGSPPASAWATNGCSAEADAGRGVRHENIAATRHVGRSNSLSGKLYASGGVGPFPQKSASQGRARLRDPHAGHRIAHWVSPVVVCRARRWVSRPDVDVLGSVRPRLARCRTANLASLACRSRSSAWALAR